MDAVPTRPMRALPLAATLMLLSGCAAMRGLEPASKVRDVATLQAAASLGNVAVSEVAWPTERWWTAYDDPQFDALMQEALAGSPSLAAAQARIEKAAAQAGLSEAGLSPTLGAGAQVSSVLIPETLAPAPLGGELKTSGVLSLNFKWAPDLWGGRRAHWNAAFGTQRASEADLQAAKLTLETNLARTYATLQQAYDMRDVAERDAARNRSLGRLAALRVKAGIDNQIGLTQITSAEANARAQMQAADQQITALKNALALLAGQGPDRALAISRPQLKADQMAVPSLLPSELVSRRPEVVAARWRVEAADRSIASAKADFYPSFNLSAMVGLAAGKLGDLFKSQAKLALGGPAITLPILDGGRLRANLRIADADFDLAVASYDQAVLSAIREVTDAVQAARALDAQIATARQARDAQARSAELVRQRQRAGLANQINVLDAQKPILQLDQQLALLRAKRLQAALDLDLALGGGVPVTGPVSATAADAAPEAASTPNPNSTSQH